MANINNDGLLDLVLVGDWMPITLMVNNGNGTFTDATKDYGLQNSQGKWNAIAIVDLDGDGHKDILTRMQASILNGRLAKINR